MGKRIGVVGLVLLLAALASAANAEDLFRILYTKRTTIGTNHVIWVSKEAQDKETLLGLAKKQCLQEFCVIWFFNDKAKASDGAVTAHATRFSPEGDVPARIAVFVRNSTSNDLVCYDPAGNCK